MTYSSDYSRVVGSQPLHNEIEVFTRLQAPQFIMADLPEHSDIVSIRFQAKFRGDRSVLFELINGDRDYGTAIIIYGTDLNRSRVKHAAACIHAVIPQSQYPEKLNKDRINEDSLIVRLNTAATASNIKRIYNSVTFSDIKYCFPLLSQQESHNKLLEFMTAIARLFEHTKLPIPEDLRSDLPTFDVVDGCGKELLNVTLSLERPNNINVYLSTLDETLITEEYAALRKYSNQLIVLQPEYARQGQIYPGYTYVTLKANKDLVLPPDKAFFYPGSLAWCQGLLNALRNNENFSELTVSGLTIPNQPDNAVDLYSFVSAAKAL